PIGIVYIRMDSTASVEIQFLKYDGGDDMTIEKQFDGIYAISKTTCAVSVYGVDTQAKSAIDRDRRAARECVMAGANGLDLWVATRCMLVENPVVEIINSDTIDRRCKIVCKA